MLVFYLLEMDNILLTYNVLDINTVNTGIVSCETGAVTLFIGTTRDTFEGRKVFLCL